jgi:hypothetical protein
MFIQTLVSFSLYSLKNDEFHAIQLKKFILRSQIGLSPFDLHTLYQRIFGS